VAASEAQGEGSSDQAPEAPLKQGRRGGRKKRIRHHVNPLSFQREVQTPDWAETFGEAWQERPLEVDVGCAKGRFLLARAETATEVNIVGLEIRVPIVELVARRIAEAKLSNAHVLCCNANVSLTELFAASSLSRVYVHFPDPWFKKRHHKRRVVNAAFLDAVRQVLRPDGEFHFATDYGEYAAEVLELLAAHQGFDDGESVAPPFGIRSEREEVHGARGDHIHRYLFRPRA